MSFTALENQMKSVIAALDAGTEFYLRDIISHPPAGLGRHLYKGVVNGTIPDVVCIGNSTGVDRYRKL